MTARMRQRSIFALLGILIVGVVMEPRLCLADSASSAPHATQQEARANPGMYSSAAVGPDWLTTTGNVKVTFAVASPIQSELEGLVIWTQTDGGTVEFDGRLANKGCVYDVEGVYTGGGGGGGGGGTVPPWYSAFDDRLDARIYLQVNNDGFDDDYVVISETGTLTVTVQGGSSSTDYTIQLQTSSCMCFDGQNGPSTKSDTVKGQGGSKSFTLYGKSVGLATITASCSSPSGVSGTNVTAIVGPRIEADLVDEPPQGATYASGINTSTIKLYLNSKQVSPSITSITNGVHISYVPRRNEVNTGSNTISASVKDNAANSQSAGWGFSL